MSGEKSNNQTIKNVLNGGVYTIGEERLWLTDETGGGGMISSRRGRCMSPGPPSLLVPSNDEAESFPTDVSSLPRFSNVSKNNKNNYFITKFLSLKLFINTIRKKKLFNNGMCTNGAFCGHLFLLICGRCRPVKIPGDRKSIGF